MRFPRPRAANAARTARTTGTITAALVAVTLATVGATSADARPWTALFDWQATSTTGTEHWTVEEQDPSPALPGPWYRTWLGTGAPAAVGRGLGVRPLGGRVYDNGDPTQQAGGPGTILRWTPPGSSTITKTAFSQLRYRNESDGQYLRVRVATANSATNQTRDFGPAYGQNDPATTYTPAAVTLTPTVPGLGVETTMFTVCAPAGGTPPSYTCPNVPSSTGTFGRIGRIEITLDDPDQPTLQVQTQPQIDGGWVNKRRPQKFTITASDPSSGVQRIQVQLKLGTSTKTLANRMVTCDPLHRTTGRAGLVCPATATLNATDPGRDSSTKDRTYVVTATDYAGNQTTQTFVVRRDLQKPTSGKLGGELARVSRNKASGRTGIVPATVTGADSQSGIARLEILARRQTGGKTYVIGAADADCASGCKKRSTLPAAADLSLLPKDGRYRLQVRVTDQAGNHKTFNSGTLFLDRKAPSAPKATVRISPRDGTANAEVKPSRDPAESSGRGDYYLLYPAATDDRNRAIRSGDHQVRQIVDQLRPLLGGPARVVRSKTRQFSLPGYDLRNAQEPGYILQTDYVRTSSGERRVRIVRVGRVATARTTAGLPLPFDPLAGVGGIVTRALGIGAGASVGIVGFSAALVYTSIKGSSAANGRLDPDQVRGCGLDCYTIHKAAGRLFSTAATQMRKLATQLESPAPLSGRGARATASVVLQQITRLRRGELARFIRTYAQAAESVGVPYVAGLAQGGRQLDANLARLSQAVTGTVALTSAMAAEETNPDKRRNRKGRQCWERGAFLREFSDSARRWNLCVITKNRRFYTATTKTRNGRTTKAYEAHHVFPRAHAARFKQAGIRNVNFPAFLCWQRYQQHRGSFRAYNAAWDDLLEDLASRHTDGKLHVSDRSEVLKRGLKFASGASNRRGADFSCKTSFALAPTATTLIKLLY